MKHIYSCECGAHTECQASDISLGAVFECPACLQVCAHVYPRRGGRAWVTVSDQDVAFYDLLGRNHEDDDDEIDFGLPANSMMPAR